MSPIDDVRYNELHNEQKILVHGMENIEDDT